MVLCIVVFTGCATRSWSHRNMASVSRYFDRDKNTVWNAILQTIEGIPIEINDKENGFLTTQWVKGWSTKKASGLLLEGRWQERYRFFVTVSDKQNKTYVSIKTQFEEKAPGGSQAYRWNRITSDGNAEKEFLKKLEDILSNQEINTTQ